MGLPIWRSPPSSPRPAAAALCDVGAARSAIRRRIPPRANRRDNVHRFLPVSRNSQSSTNSGARSRSQIATLDSLSSHASALSLSSLNARLNDLQESAVHLRNQHRQLLEAHAIASETESRDQTPALVITNDYGLPYVPAANPGLPITSQYERSINRYQARLLRARQEIQRLEAEGLQVDEQRRRLNRLHTDFYNRHLPYNDLDVSTTFISLSRLRDDSEPVPHIISVPGRFTSSPQPIQDTMSSSTARVSLPSSSRLSVPEMERRTLRRMSDGNIDDHSPERTVIEAYTVEEAIEDFHDGLGDRNRSVEPDEAEEESWNTMLATIAPDDRLPSASSSFASDAASRSFSSSNSSSRAPSAFSSGTTVTVPEDNGCDTEEIWRTIGERFNRGEDVPDELWVNAGVPISTARVLARSMRERL
ncbi:uncharacterized protein PV09_03801 [Verruconis gallopava]|uniref:Uncharacterized protein n=1 Tax=Verruconis gallopava TaxID=253628 RepID=A0A0D2B1Q5_9PEZI|nr:uncharacterized protein PV09_03801 [Verruconis gallopava]KIW05269.1 hypothetical protein PV09_03801 [Verruconis gallopava]